MGQPDSRKSSNVGTDVTEKGARVRADGGLGSTMRRKGDEPTRADLERILPELLQRAVQYRMPIEQEWLASYTQYNGETFDNDKAGWQSQIHIPKAVSAVDRAAGRVTSVIFSTEDWLSPLSPSKALDPKLDFAKRLIMLKLKKAKGKGPVVEAMKNAMICGHGPLKVHWRKDLEEQSVPTMKPNPQVSFLGEQYDTGGAWTFQDVMVPVSELAIEALLPWDFFLDPTGLCRWVVHRSKRNLTDLWKMAEPLKDASGRTVRPAIYDPKVVELVHPGDRNWYIDTEIAVQRRERLIPNQPELVDVWEFWGDVPDPVNGTTLWSNVFTTFVGNKCLRMPERNPFLHRSNPFILIRPSLRPGQIYGRGILAQALRLEQEIDRYTGTLIDRARAAMGMFEADPTALRNPQEFASGKPQFKPLVIWTLRPGPDRKFLRPVDGPAPIGEWEYELLNNLHQQHDGTTQVTEEVTGNDTSRKRKTRAEVQNNVNAAQQPFNDTAQYIEESALSPLVNLIYALIVQYQDFKDPTLMEVFADNPDHMRALQGLALMSLPERWKALKLSVPIEVSGVTLDITRQQMMGRIQQWMQMNGLDPAMAAVVNKGELQRLNVRLLNLPPELVLPNADDIVQQISQAMLMQMAAQASASAGAPPQGMNPNNQGAALAAQGRSAGAGGGEEEPVQ